MNIKLSYDFNFREFQKMFPEIELLDLNKSINSKEKIDLLIFPGGSDVSMKYYADREEIKQYSKLCSFDQNRDAVEFEIINSVFKRTLNVKKVLGICRGCQFLNVAFGGTLFPDLGSFNKQHEQVHPLKFLMDSSLSFLSLTNSFHHQGIRIVGEVLRYQNKYVDVKVLAIDPKTSLPEIVSWDTENYLGVQSHPEYFNSDIKEFKLFRDSIVNWVNGESLIKVPFQKKGNYYTLSRVDNP